MRHLISIALAAALCGCGNNDKPLPRDTGPDVLAPVTLGYDQLLEACLRLYACDVGRKPGLMACASDFYDVIAYNGQRVLFERIYDCVNTGQADCKIIRECVGYKGRPAKCDASYEPSCKGEVAYNCDLLNRDDGWEWGLDCAKGGLKCAVKASAGSTTKAAICGGGPCEASYKPECRAKKRYTCTGGALEVRDCPERALQCRDPIIDDCEGTGRSCPPVQPSCKGSVLSNCQKDYLWEVDCKKLPGKKICAPAQLKCVGAGTECSEGFDVCEGNTLVSCIDGYKRRYDCVALGFLACEKAPAGKFGAYCKAEPVYE